MPTPMPDSKAQNPGGYNVALMNFYDLSIGLTVIATMVI
jgi:hypothetical protein